ncbi:MAG TPA: Hsp70 family protein [Vitreimonas sp.]|jgi:molecular chaperone DnaK (HSP70)|nr:Hsp70 family protein [Vitreimonas sp.]
MADGEPDRNFSRARICIDFGTALSKASVCLDPMLPLEVGVRPIAIGAVAGADHPLLVPSIMFVDNGRLFFGPAAFEYARRGAAQSRDPLLSFKTVLGARDVKEALMTRLPPSIDPTGTFRLRDALVLYLAYLDQLIRAALASAPNMPQGVADVQRRYTSPVWRAGSGADHIFEGIFNEADAISKRIGRLLLAREGVSIAQCRDALDKAIAQPGDGHLETGIFEPHAAAAASMAFSNEPTRFVMVFDMGAGTTDIAAFEWDESVDPPSLSEIKEARQCSGLAGDEIDRILIELYWRKRSGERNREEEMRLLRTTKLLAREMKKELFASGRVMLKGGWIGSTIRIQEFMDDPQFREYQRALASIIAQSLRVVMHRAQMVRAPVVDIVLAGGGSHLPFLTDMVRAVAPPNTGVQLRIAPLSPMSTLYEGVDPSLSVAFPQIAMSVGGALVEMMPAA